MATAPTYSDFSSRFPALVANPVPTASQETWIADRIDFEWYRHPASVWQERNPNLRTEAVLLYVAHLWVVESQDKRGARGKPSSKSVGGWSLSNQPFPSDATTQLQYLQQTTYGQQYLALKASIIAGPVVARGKTSVV